MSILNQLFLAVALLAVPGVIDARDEPPLVLVTVLGEVDKELSKRIVVHAKQSLDGIAFDTVVSGVQDGAAVDIYEQKLAGSKGRIIVVLANRDSDKGVADIVEPRLGALLNISGLRVTTPVKTLTAEEQYARRLEKHLVWGVAKVFRLADCPNPFCVLKAHTTELQFDTKGRNLCPPCLKKMKNTLGQK